MAHYLDVKAAYWGDCTNTFDEEQKHYVYARYMGLGRKHYSFDAQGRRVLDIGGRVLIQEVIHWIDPAPLDCITMFAKAGSGAAEPVHLSNPRSMEEAAAIRDFQAHYSRIEKGEL
jgi:hypothetical protein